MLKIISAIVLACCVASTSMADYIADREAAVKLSQSGKHAEALDAFLKLAEGAETDVQKSDAYEQAALSAMRLRKLDQAMELALKITDEAASKSCQIAILESGRKWSDIVTKFGGEDFDKWPREMAGPAYATRGRAYYTLKQAEKAEADLVKAVELLVEGNAKGNAINNLGDTYRVLMNDDARALEVYRQAYKTAFYKRCQAVIYVAGILSKQKKHDEALAELQTIDMKQVKHPSWQAEMLQAYAQVYEAQGKKEEAAARYEEALKIEGLSAANKASYEKKVKALRGEAQ